MKNKSNTDILFGPHSVIEALKANRRDFRTIFISKDIASSERGLTIRELAEERRVPLKEMSSINLKQKTGSDLHQGVGAEVGPYPAADIHKVLATLHSASFLLIADGIQDPQNLGALLRTALCAGVDAVIIPRNRAAPPTPTVSRTSAGALEHLQLVRATNITDVIKDLKKNNLWIIGTDLSAGTPVFSADLNVPLALIIGSEGKGIRPLVKKNCDLLISIPQRGSLGSLNASAAGAVVMYEVFRQRTPGFE